MEKPSLIKIILISMITGTITSLICFLVLRGWGG